jgi:hypothetical protein
MTAGGGWDDEAIGAAARRWWRTREGGRGGVREPTCANENMGGVGEEEEGLCGS